ncbi:HD domain-containing protein [Legionella shakespearei]|uniref:Putative hydrolase n=1 Tax=Legionella shakespearei DSM 23087 TaxID=1122169 RepID=A0A0W0YL59_9GAMM|nr:HD domain-containing protein [Legionella shakespearei]KTD57657.1 putative hydrolase [Legionella shakespearei DSM 23087]
MNVWERVFTEYLTESCSEHDDASHDLDHFRRVAHTARRIAALEQEIADSLVILAAAYFHDIVSLPKNHPDNNKSSLLAALKAKEILREMGFPEEKLDSVGHAIEAHSFSANKQPETIEAKIVQDSDRMEALGALGIMRTFYVSGRLNREPYDSKDPFAKNRPLDDKQFGLDHFYCKLFKLPELLQTEGGRQLAIKRTDTLHLFVNELAKNLAAGEGEALVLVRACYKAGNEGYALFHHSDPLALQRPLEENRYALDTLLKAEEKPSSFIMPFLSRLYEEIRADENH